MSSVLLRCLQAAQEREELQAAGDVLDAKITQCEAEVRCSQRVAHIDMVSVQCGTADGVG
jgi:hypothetical protein